MVWNGLPVAETYSTNVGYRVVSQNVCYLFFTGCVLKAQPFLYRYKGGEQLSLQLTLFMLLYWELLSKGVAELIVCDAYGRRQGYTTDERSGCHGGLWDEYGCGMDAGHQSKPVETHEEGEMVGATGFS